MAKKSAAWQRKEGKNEKGGLNEKGRKSYERENPGSDLKPPVKKRKPPNLRSLLPVVNHSVPEWRA